MRLTIEPPPAGRSGELQESGPWALFRLIGRGRLQAQAGAADRYTLTFQLGERQVVFDIRMQGAGNALTPGMLPDFRCPGVRTN